MNAPGALGETAGVYKLCQLFTANPALHYHSITIHESGRIEVAVDGGVGVVHDWARALPNRRETVGLARTAYGSTEAVVLTEEPIVVTVRPVFGGAA
jgi:hypothetical protein